MPEDEITRVREQLRFREANDRLRQHVNGYRFEAADRVPFICECADPGCFESVMFSIEEYDRLRGHPSWFLLAAGHEEEHEQIVESERGYSIVEAGEATRSPGSSSARCDRD